MSIAWGKKKILGIHEISVEGKTVFCRVDFNAPIEDGKVSDDTRLRASLPTIDFLVKKGAKVVLASHLGRPKGKAEPKYSLLPVAECLAELTKREVLLPDDCVGTGVRRILSTRKPEALVLLENLRFHAAEEKNDIGFARELQVGMDVYVSDAFGSLHRAHASTDALPRLFTERAAGELVEKELQALVPLLESPMHPYAVILGGAKVSDKIKIIGQLLRKVDSLLIGGAMVFTFLKVLGHRVGNSLVEEASLSQAEQILSQARSRNVRVVLPIDFRLGRSVDQPGEEKISDGVDIPEGFMGLDIGPKSVELFSERLRSAKTIFWNGPLGLFEKPPFDSGTVAIAQLLGELQGATRVIGGGDSVSAVHRAGVAEKMTHVSTGGGATLEFLEGKGLPGLDALAV